MIGARYNVVVKAEVGKLMQGDSTRTSESAWRDLYLAALFEADSARLPERIAAAEYALSLRDRELWYSGGDHHEEKHAVISAMRALEALRNIHQCPGQVSSASSRRAEVGPGALWRSG